MYWNADHNVKIRAALVVRVECPDFTLGETEYRSRLEPDTKRLTASNLVLNIRTTAEHI